MADEFINVSLAKVPGPRNGFTLNGDRTIEALLAAAETDADGYQIRINGSAGTLASALSDGDEVVLVKMVKGNDGR